MKYTLEQLTTLRDIYLSKLDRKEMLDDNYSNDYNDFLRNTDLFLKWIEEMESENKIESLLS